MASDILSIFVGEVWREFPLVDKWTGDPINTGGFYYLQALSGPNAGKWWNDSITSWVDTAVAHPMTYGRDGNWIIKLTTPGPFEEGVVYFENAESISNLHIAGMGRLLRGQVVVDVVVLDPDTYAAISQLISDSVAKGNKTTVFGPAPAQPVQMPMVRRCP